MGKKKQNHVPLNSTRGELILFHVVSLNQLLSGNNSNPIWDLGFIRLYLSSTDTSKYTRTCSFHVTFIQVFLRSYKWRLSVFQHGEA